MELSFVGSATLNGAWHELVTTLAGHRLWGCACGVRAPGFEQFEDREVPAENSNLCEKSQRNRGIEPLGLAANVQHIVNVGLGQPVAPTQTVGRLEKARSTGKSSSILCAISMTM